MDSTTGSLTTPVKNQTWLDPEMKCFSTTKILNYVRKGLENLQAPTAAPVVKETEHDNADPLDEIARKLSELKHDSIKYRKRPGIKHKSPEYRRILEEMLKLLFQLDEQKDPKTQNGGRSKLELIVDINQSREELANGVCRNEACAQCN